MEVRNFLIQFLIQKYLSNRKCFCARRNYLGINFRSCLSARRLGGINSETLIVMASLMEEVATFEAKRVVHNDSSGAKASASRREFTKVRHFHTKHLWLQDQVSNGEVVLEKAHWFIIIVDALTKYHSSDSIVSLLAKVDVHVEINAWLAI